MGYVSCCLSADSGHEIIRRSAVSPDIIDSEVIAVVVTQIRFDLGVKAQHPVGQRLEYAG